MKYILWAMFKWGGGIAVFLAFLLAIVYYGAFVLISKKWTWHEYYISHLALKWVWVLGFIELGFLGGLYHLLPQYFPALIAEFFFT